MKLSEITDNLWSLISQEEDALELPVKKAFISVRLQRGKEIILHNWEYTAKEKEAIK